MCACSVRVCAHANITAAYREVREHIYGVAGEHIFLFLECVPAVNEFARMLISQLRTPRGRQRRRLSSCIRLPGPNLRRPRLRAVVALPEKKIKKNMNVKNKIVASSSSIP